MFKPKLLIETIKLSGCSDKDCVNRIGRFRFEARQALSGFAANGLLLFRMMGGLLLRRKKWGTAMKPARLSNPARSDRRHRLRIGRAATAALVVALLAGCEQNTFVPPPPPKVDVAAPVQRTITRYLEATGNTAPIKTVDLVARVVWRQR